MTKQARWQWGAHVATWSGLGGCPTPSLTHAIIFLQSFMVFDENCTLVLCVAVLYLMPVLAASREGTVREDSSTVESQEGEGQASPRSHEAGPVRKQGE